MTLNPSPAPASASDGALAAAVIGAGLAGSPVEEAELCRRFGRRVRLYGRRRLRDDGAVDDLVQRVLLLLVTKLRGGEVREYRTIMNNHANLKIIKSLYAAFGAGEPKDIFALLAPEVEWVAPGTAPWCGEGRGLEYVQRFLRSSPEREART